jgi:hypothetical protein
MILPFIRGILSAIAAGGVVQEPLSGGGDIRDIGPLSMTIVNNTATVVGDVAGSFGDYVIKENTYNANGVLTTVDNIFTNIPFTFECRLLLPTYTGQSGYIWMKIGVLWCRINTDGTISINTQAGAYSIPAGVTTGSWFHFVWVYYGNTGTDAYKNTFYINGIKIVNKASHIISQVYSLFTLGGEADNTQFHDYIEEVIMYAGYTNIYPETDFIVPNTYHNKSDTRIKFYITARGITSQEATVEGGSTIRNLAINTDGISVYSAYPAIADGSIGDYVIQFGPVTRDTSNNALPNITTTLNINYGSGVYSMFEYRFFLSSLPADKYFIWYNPGAAGSAILSDGSFKYYNVLQSGIGATTSPGLISAGQWYHIVEIYDGSTQMYSLWINGSRIFDSISASTNGFTGSVYFGSTEATNILQGYIEEVLFRQASNVASLKAVYGDVANFTPPSTPRYENEAGWDRYLYISPRSTNIRVPSDGGTIKEVSINRYIITNYAATVQQVGGSLGDYVMKLDNYSASGTVYVATYFLQFGKNRTMEFRFRIDDWDSRTAHMIFRGASTVYIQVNDDGSITIGNYNNTITTSAGLVQLGQWYHLAHSFTMSSSTNTLWLDGTRVMDSQVLTCQSWYERLRMGGDSATTQFKGYVEEFLMYNSDSIYTGATITVPTTVHSEFDPRLVMYLTPRNV